MGDHKTYVAMLLLLSVSHLELTHFHCTLCSNLCYSIVYMCGVIHTHALSSLLSLSLSDCVGIKNVSLGLCWVGTRLLLASVTHTTTMWTALRKLLSPLHLSDRSSRQQPATCIISRERGGVQRLALSLSL